MAKAPKKAPKAPKAEVNNILIIRYDWFHRFWNSLTISGLIIIMVGGFFYGVSTITILYRSVLVYAILGLAGRIIIKSWASWEEMKRGETQAGKR